MQHSLPARPSFMDIDRQPLKAKRGDNNKINKVVKSANALEAMALFSKVAILPEPIRKEARLFWHIVASAGRTPLKRSIIFADFHKKLSDLLCGE